MPLSKGKKKLLINYKFLNSCVFLTEEGGLVISYTLDVKELSVKPGSSVSHIYKSNLHFKGSLYTRWKGDSLSRLLIGEAKI